MTSWLIGYERFYKMIKNKKFTCYRFCLPEADSPTYFNLCQHLKAQGWSASRFDWFSHFSAKNFEFDVGAAATLEYKHLLARLVSQYCPDVMPESYPINDRNWPSILSHVADKHYMKDGRLVDQVDNLIWILKPALLNNGQQIKIFQELSQIEQHYFSSNRLGGEHVLQQYLTRPHLLNGNKYSIRMFVVMTNYAGVYLYPHGYFNVALHPYQSSNFNDVRAHLTNEHLNEDEINVKQVPTQELDYLFSRIYPQIKTIVTATVNGLQSQYPDAFRVKRQRKLALFGFDFMVDMDSRTWLLEANHGPCFPMSDEHALQKKLYHYFWEDFISSFVVPISKRQSQPSICYQVFEKLVM